MICFYICQIGTLYHSRKFTKTILLKYELLSIKKCFQLLVNLNGKPILVVKIFGKNNKYIFRLQQVIQQQKLTYKL